MDSPTDEELIQNLRQGDMQAFEELYHRYKRHIFTFCLKLTGDRMLAEDTTHDTFIKMHRSIDSLSDVRLFRTWLFTIARNGVFNQLRKGHRNGSVEDGSVWTDETPLSLTERTETSAIVSACISGLKAEYKEVLILREYEQKSYEEIAAITGNSESSVKSRLFKARKALAQKLRPYFAEG